MLLNECISIKYLSVHFHENIYFDKQGTFSKNYREERFKLYDITFKILESNYVRLSFVIGKNSNCLILYFFIKNILIIRTYN